MKAHNSKLTALVLFITFFLAACSKDDVFKNPIPGTGHQVDSVSFRFAAAVSLTGEPYHSSNLTAVVSIANEKNETVVTEKMLLLNLNGTVTTQTLKLPAGTYKLNRFRLVYGSVNTHFATPVIGSAKATLVQKPLAMAFTIAKTGTNEIPVEVVRVQKGEHPEQYGYPRGSFDNNQAENDPYLKIKLRAVMQVGKIVYDSIPASLRTTTWNSTGEMSTTYSQLKAGITELSILKSGARFEFQVTKWGTDYKLTLDRDHVNEDSVYILGGVKEAKLLKSEITYKLVAGAYKAESKTEYVYDAGNKLSKINYYQKRRDNTAYLAMTDVFEYNGAHVQNIRRYDEAKKETGITAFTYDPQGRVRTIVQNENGQRTNATVEYTNNTHPEVTLHYTYPGQLHTMDYVMMFYGGNMITGNAFTSHQSSETGRYDYDFSINPYVHMNWPNLFLSNSSKNNVTAQYKTYQYNFPVAEPYGFTYSYDGDGYPKELVKQFKSYLTGSHLYTTKTVYVY